MKTPIDLPQVDDFVSSVLMERSGSVHTQNSYLRDLQLFAEFLKSSGRTVGDFVIEGFLRFCTQKDIGRRSQARALSAIRGYTRFLVSRGVLSVAPRIELPKYARPLPKVPDLAIIEKLFQACKETDGSKTLRNKMVLTLLYGTGCRVSELVALNLVDVYLDQGVLEVKGKGSKVRRVPLATEVSEVVRDYIELARPQLSSPLDAMTLIVNDRRHRPSRVDIFRWLKKWSQTAGLEEAITPHQLRHACATHLLEGGADLRSIQTLLGHSNIATTQVYTQVEHSHLKALVDEHHPLSTDSEK